MLLLLLMHSTSADLSEKDIATITNIVSTAIMDSERRVTTAIMDKVSHGFRTLHDFGSDRVEAIRAASKRVHAVNRNDECSLFSTSHTVYLDDNVVQIFTPHANCTLEASNLVLDLTLDLGAIKDCPEAGSTAINITSFAQPKLGDNLISFGFGLTAHVWHGFVAKYVEDDANCVAPAKHFSGRSKICKDEIVAQSNQHEGMSGAAVANGCGYIGMCHAVISGTQLTTFAAIIGAESIRQFIRANKHYFPILSDCSNVKVIEMPRMPFINCDSNSYCIP